jgi:formate-dependent nitrite reductase membrane component NrfD
MNEPRPLSRGNGRPPGTTSWHGSVSEAGTTMRSYYGRPIIKEPVWKPEIPFYFFTGGLAGVSSVLSLAARAAGNEQLAKTSLFAGAIADAASPALLISDLGRPERFLNMLRVFKATSPMSVGSWVLAASGAASGTAAALEVLQVLKPVRLAAEIAAALLGPALATYTATLVSNTAVPVWHEARHELPFVFAGSAAASAGAMPALVLGPRESRPARRLAIGGVIAELVAMQVMERRLGFLGEPYRRGAAGVLTRVAKALTAGGAAVLAWWGSRSRAGARAGAALLLAGEVLVRWGVFRAGFQSAQDPRYTIVPQRERATTR